MNDPEATPPPAADEAERALIEPQPSPSEGDVRDLEQRRAIVVFVDDNRDIVQQALALRESWRYAQSPDTDLVVMGPDHVLTSLPDDMVKIPQRPAADDPLWQGNRYINAIACLNAAGSELLDRYTHLLRTHADTFITPAWNQFYPDIFMFGPGAYSNDDHVRQRIVALSAEYGLTHRGLINVGTTWYGPTEEVRRACAFAEMLARRLLTHDFAADEGAWPGWYRGVATKYADEIAVNHCAPDAQRSDLLDASSTSGEPISDFPHIHCWHTDDKFSKHWFMAGRYTEDDAQGLDLGVVRDYCMAMSFRSLDDAPGGQDASAGDAPDGNEIDPAPERLTAEPSEHGGSVVHLSKRTGDALSADPPWREGALVSESMRRLATRGSDLPLVSCLCASYNRPPSHQHLIEEAIESFLRQDYPNKELIVINDTAGQELVCDASGVRIINVSDRFPTLGDKYNAAADLARGDLLAPWDDDDISLPWRLSLSVERLGETAYFNPRSYWFLDGSGFHFDHNVGYAHNASLVTRAAFEAVGRYTQISVGYDADIDAALWSRFEDAADPRRDNNTLTRGEWIYIYRWGVSPGHVSGGGTEENYREIGKRPVEAGRFHLSPHWRMDYVAATRQLLDVEVAGLPSPRDGDVGLTARQV